jgi:hypothetical protein
MKSIQALQQRAAAMRVARKFKALGAAAAASTMHGYSLAIT